MTGTNKIDSASAGDMTSTRVDYSLAPTQTDGPGDQNETTWINTDFGQYLVYYQKIPELKSTINTKSKWLIGKGVQADTATMKILDGWRGWGKDTKNTILQNMSVVTDVGGARE